MSILNIASKSIIFLALLPIVTLLSRAGGVDLSPTETALLTIIPLILIVAFILLVKKETVK